MPMPVPPSGPIRTAADRKRWRAYQDWAQSGYRAFNEEIRRKAAEAAAAKERERAEMARQQQRVSVSLTVMRKDLGLLDETLEVARGAMARRYHPDIGGNGDEMRRVNALIDTVRKAIASAHTALGPGW